MGNRRRRNSNFWKSLHTNNQIFSYWFDRLMSIAISIFEWRDLPDTVDQRFLELTITTRGSAVFFDEQDVGYLATMVTYGAPLNVYNVPTYRRAYASNGFNRELGIDNSVLIYDNLMHCNIYSALELFAFRLYNCLNVIDVNINAQKTPIAIQATEKQRLTMENLYMQYDGNYPYIFTDKDAGLTENVQVIQTGAPYIADKVREEMNSIWNEAMTYLGVPNVGEQKRERQNTMEMLYTMGGTMASRYNRLNAREQAAKEINNMFGLNVSVGYRENSLGGQDEPDISLMEGGPQIV